MEEILQSNKKCQRKQKRAQHRLARDMNIKCSEQPTDKLTICNAGLVTGLPREKLEELITEIIPEYQLLMPPGKSYCFIKFTSIEDAKVFYNQVHGLQKVPGENTVMYLNFIESIPEIGSSNSQLPNGLRVVEDFISEEEEIKLLESIDWDKENESELKHRKVKHFGYKFEYGTNMVNVDCPIEPIPESYEYLQSRFVQNDCGPYIYDQLTINRYLPGQGIPPHIDTHSIFEGTILSLSLGSSCVMDFKSKGNKVSVTLPARSLLIMSNESRYAWTHGICPRHSDMLVNDSGNTICQRGTRVSFTFRKVRRGDCPCNFKEYCDTAKLTSTAIDNSIASGLEQSYVHAVYEEISGHFNETRHKQWPNVAKFIETVQPGGLLLDVGCGNGKYLQGDRTDIYKMGCDRSSGLSEICRTQGFETLLSDCLHLPYKTNTLDAALCIAVIHHLSTNERREQAVAELVRILRPGGRCLIYVWAKDQKKNCVSSTYLRFNPGTQTDNHLRVTELGVSLPVHENRTQFQHSDMLVPWKRKGGGDFLRYYHVFQDGELEELCRKVCTASIIDIYYDQGNWCAVLEKL